MAASPRRAVPLHLRAQAITSSPGAPLSNFPRIRDAVMDHSEPAQCAERTSRCDGCSVFRCIFSVGHSACGKICGALRRARMMRPDTPSRSAPSRSAEDPLAARSRVASMSSDTQGGWSMALSDNVHAHDGRARSGRVGCHARKDARVRPEFSTLWVRHGSGLQCALEASAALIDSSPSCSMTRECKNPSAAPALARGGNSSSRAAPARPRCSSRAQRAQQ